MRRQKSNSDISEELAQMLLVLPMLEAHRETIKEAVERLKYLDD